jgi:hypothetical protein
MYVVMPKCKMLPLLLNILLDSKKIVFAVQGAKVIGLLSLCLMSLFDVRNNLCVHLFRVCLFVRHC